MYRVALLLKTNSFGFLNFYSNINRIKVNVQTKYKRKDSTYRESLLISLTRTHTHTHTQEHARSI